jgi:hypothetical protein
MKLYVMQKFKAEKSNSYERYSLESSVSLKDKEAKIVSALQAAKG